MKQGFTLVELAIVIVIIGLLVGGVLQGKELIEQSKINSTISKINSYNSAVNTFKAKYNAIQGDINKPGPFGLNSPKGTTIANVSQTSSVTPTATTGGAGNGNNVLESNYGPAFVSNTYISYPPYWNNGEILNFFIHLSNTQFVKESFTVSGIEPDPFTTPPVPGLHYPAMSVGTGMAMISSIGSYYWVVGTYKYMLGPSNSIGNSLTPLQTASIDTKLDNGDPLTGIVQVVSNYDPYATGNNFTIAPTGANNCISTSGSYNFTGTNADKSLCTIRIKSNF